jgi:hypothetical protein
MKLPQCRLATRHASGRPGLGALCEKLGSVGCVLSLRGPFDAALIESDASGRCSLSGAMLSEDGDGQSFLGNPIASPLIQFSILPVAIELLDIDDYGQLFAELKREYDTLAY